MQRLSQRLPHSLRNAVVDNPVELIGDKILAAAVASVSFNVPRGYGILILLWHWVLGDDDAVQSGVLTFNSDTGNNYDYSRSAFGAASSTTNGAAGIDIFRFANDTSQDYCTNGFLVILNRAGQEKVGIGTFTITPQAVVANENDLISYHLQNKWRNISAEISTMTITPSGGNFLATARFILLGVKI